MKPTSHCPFPAPLAVVRRASLSVLVALALTACSRSESQPAPPPPPAVSVAAAIEREVAEWDEFSGRLEAVESVQLHARVSGYIQSIHFKPGAEVKKGDLLVQIDPRPFQAEVARAEAALASAQTRQELAKTELARAQILLEDKAISQRDYDQQLASRKDLDTGIRAAQAALQTAKLNLEYASVRAPISGRISKEEVTVGNLVQGDGASPTLLTSIVSVDPIYASFEGDEQAYLKYTRLARSGVRPSSRTTKNPVFMGLANEEGYPHKGYMEFVDNQIDPQTGTIRARAVFDNKDGSLTPGLFARIKLIGSGTYRAVLIDEKAIGTDQSKKFVLVLGPESKLAYRPIKLGPLIDGLRVVSEGLKGGEVIVVNGIQHVRPGVQVQAQSVPMEVDKRPAPEQQGGPEKKAGGSRSVSS